VVATQPLQYLRQDSISFQQRLTIREAQHLITEAIQLLGSNAISHQCIRLEMLSPIEFDNQHRFDTSEVCEVPTDRALATEFVAIELAIAQSRPQGTLSVG
jgi:hypothetical protein